MNDSSEEEAREKKKEFLERVGAEEARKLRARRRKEQSIWLGLGMIGTVGWAVAVPTLLGLALGIWLDVTFPGPFSWTLTLLLGGLALGLVNAWYWIMREQRMIERERSEKDDEREGD